MNDYELIEYWKELSERYNIDNCNDYIQKIRDSGYIPFIGAGMSVSFRYPMWTEFLDKRINELAESDIEKKASLKKRLENGEYLEVAEEIDEELNHGLVEHVRRSFKRKKIEDDSINYISFFKKKGIKTFVTTNYDPVIEELFKKISTGNEKMEVFLPNRLRDIDEIQDAIRTGKTCLIKLHGTYDNAHSIVLTKSQYDNYYSEGANIIETLSLLLPRKPLLFMGCSLSKDYLYDAIEEKAKSNNYWNYAILMQPQSSKDLIKKTSIELLKLKIRPIWFPNNEYDSIYSILDLLAMEAPFLKDDRNSSNLFDLNNNSKNKEVTRHEASEIKTPGLVNSKTSNIEISFSIDTQELRTQEDKEIILSFTEVNIERYRNRYRKYTREDIYDEYLELLSDDEVETYLYNYNDRLPKEEKIIEYAQEMYNYEMKRCNAFNLDLSVMNLGAIYRANIVIRIQFPDDIKVVKKAFIKELAIPEAPSMPMDPNIELTYSFGYTAPGIPGEVDYEKPIFPYDNNVNEINKMQRESLEESKIIYSLLAGNKLEIYVKIINPGEALEINDYCLITTKTGKYNANYTIINSNTGKVTSGVQRIIVE